MLSAWGYIADQLVVNPTYKELEKSSLNMVVAGTRDAIVMVEGGARELPESIIHSALETATAGIAALYRSATASATYCQERARCLSQFPCEMQNSSTKSATMGYERLKSGPSHRGQA